MNTTATITKITDEAQGIKSFHLKLKEPMMFKAGQYIMIAFKDDLERKKAFSVIHTNKENDEVKLGIKVEHEFTQRLFNTKEGTTLEASGPYGRFNLPEKDRNIVFIAGGIGITPILSMLTAYSSDKKRKSNVTIYFSSRTKEMMPFFNEIEMIKDPRITKRYIFTNEHVKGYMHDQLRVDKIKTQVQDWKEAIYMICGPPLMMTSIRSQLQNEGIPDEDIRSESFV